jgi:pyridoxal phosphate enzyme (YggS family)
MQDFSLRLVSIRERIAAAAEKGGFDPDRVQIVAASKSRSVEQIRALYKTGGIVAAGENRVQEFLGKYSPDITFDFIGRLQTNKVKYIIDKVRLIQSVDRESLLIEINKQALARGIVSDILIEVNSGMEEAKGGIAAEDTLDFAKTIQEYKGVRLRGIMAVAPIADADTLRRCFNDVYKAYCVLQKNYPDIDYLSMGMSEDFPIAVECGSNMVRLGRILFEEAL